MEASDQGNPVKTVGYRHYAEARMGQYRWAHFRTLPGTSTVWNHDGRYLSEARCQRN